MKKLNAAFALVFLASFASAQVVINPGGGGGVSAGSNVVGCTINSIVYINSSGNLACGGSPAPRYSSGTVTIDNGVAAVSPLVVNDNGSPVMTVADGGQLQVIAGASGAPAIKFATGTNAGFYNRAADRIAVTGGGAQTLEFDSGGTYLASNGVHLFLSGALGTGADSSIVRQGVGVLRVGDGGAGYGWLAQHGEIALNADYTNATATFSNTALSVSLVSGRTYNFTLNLLMADSTAADGMKIDFNGGAATITNFRVNCMATNDTTGATVAFTAATSTALATVLNVSAMASTGTHMVMCNGTIVPSSSSTFIVRAAQNAHSTGTLTISRGSWMSIRDARPL